MYTMKDLALKKQIFFPSKVTSRRCSNSTLNHGTRSWPWTTLALPRWSSSAWSRSMGGTTARGRHRNAGHVRRHPVACHQEEVRGKAEVTRGRDETKTFYYKASRFWYLCYCWGRECPLPANVCYCCITISIARGFASFMLVCLFVC